MKYYDIDTSPVHQERLLRKSREQGKSIDEITFEEIGENIAYENFLRYGPMGVASGVRAEFMQRFSLVNAADRFELGTNAGGGFSVPEFVVVELLNRLEKWDAIRREATVVQVGDGRKRRWVNADDTSIDGAIVTEAGKTAPVGDGNAQLTTLDAEFDTYTSREIEVTQEMLQDSAVDIIGHIVNMAAGRIGRIQNNYFTNGSADANHNVNGILDGIGEYETTKDFVDPVDLVNLLKTISDEYMAEAKFMVNSDTYLRIINSIFSNRTTYHSMLSRDEGFSTLMGWPLVLNNALEDFDSTNKPLIFGDFKYFFIFDSMNMALTRLEGDDRRAKRLVGFVMHTRSASRLADLNAAKAFAVPA